MSINRCIRLVKRPVGKITHENLKVSNESIPVPSDGQVLVENLYLSIDPTHRIWMSDIPQYMAPVKLGDVMRAMSLGVIKESKHPDWKVGTYVVAAGGVCDFYVSDPAALREVPDDSTKWLSIASVVIGLTSWHGVNKILDPRPGDVCVVSGAAGAVGSLVSQLCKFKGAKVVGIAGGPEKCNYLTEELGLDLAIDYKTQDIETTLKTFAVEGVACYFDNVGGSVTDAVLMNMKNSGKVAVCGSISEYNDDWVGCKNFNMAVMRRLTITGFIGRDHFEEFGEATSEILSLAASGKLKYKEDVREGLENYVDVVNLLFTGENTGKLILKV